MNLNIVVDDYRLFRELSTATALHLLTQLVNEICIVIARDGLFVGEKSSRSLLSQPTGQKGYLHSCHSPRTQSSCEDRCTWRSTVNSGAAQFGDCCLASAVTDVKGDARRL